MTQTSPEELLRQAEEAEGGMPVSAGGRIAHLRLALESGRAFYVDLSSVPEGKRPAVIAEIKELVKRASAGVAQKASSGSQTSPDTQGQQ
jgi:hypothetical protein